MKQWLTNKRDRLIDQSRSKIRERAIQRAKARMALHGKKVTDFDEEGLEAIVKDEEDKIVQQLKKSTLYAVLIFVGLGHF